MMPSGLLAGAQEVAWGGRIAAAVEGWLDHQDQPADSADPARIVKRAQESGARPAWPTLPRLAGHDVDVTRADRCGVGYRLVDRGARFRLAARDRAKPHISGRGVARPRIQSHHRQLKRGERGSDRRCRDVEGIVELHRIEAGGLGAVQALQKRQLAPQKTEIGRKAQHVSSAIPGGRITRWRAGQSGSARLGPVAP
jgi:hypothetical protein